MIKRHYSTVDSRTGLTLVLSDVSYNVAMDWLQRDQEKLGREIIRCENLDSIRTVINTGVSKSGFDFDGNPTVWFTNLVKFFYDEDRGVLLQE